MTYPSGITDNTAWPDDVALISSGSGTLTDPGDKLLGGNTGPLNAGLIDLVKRTNYLKEAIRLIGAPVTDGAVITRFLADGAVTEIKLASLAVSTRTLADAAVTGAKIALGAVALDKINTDTAVSGKVLKSTGPGSAPVWSDLPLISQAVKVRNTVNDCAANMLTASATPLAINLLATLNPVALTFAAGFNAAGQVDIPAYISADLPNFWQNIPANTTSALFIDRDVNTGALTGVVSNLSYKAIAGNNAAEITNGQHSYLYDKGLMKVGNGSTANLVQRIQVGEVATNATSITNIIQYSCKRTWDSEASLTIVNASNQLLTHNIGTNKLEVTPYLECIADVAGYSAGTRVFNIVNTNSNYSYPFALSVGKYSLAYSLVSSCLPQLSDGNIVGITAASFKLGFKVKAIF